MGKTGVPGEAPYSACFGTGAVLCRLGGPENPGDCSRRGSPFYYPAKPNPPCCWLLLPASYMFPTSRYAFQRNTQSCALVEKRRKSAAIMQPRGSRW